MATNFLLMRHGEAEWTRVANAIGWGADLAPLTPKGRLQVEARIPEIAAWKPSHILASPMTRALESALIVNQTLKLPLEVRFELHEWIPKLSFDWRELSEVLELQRDFLACGGEWPQGERRPWEPASSVRSRAIGELSRCAESQRVLVVAHGVLMYTLCGKWEIENAELVPFRL